jgi:cell shape-determining protein MreC
MDKIQESALIQSMKKTIEEYDKRFKELNCINERLLDSKKTNKKLKEELNIKRDEYLDFYKKHIKSSS